MTTFSLTVQTAREESPNFAVPEIAVTPFFAEQTGLLAVIFDVKNSPTSHFEANFPTYDALTLLRILQQDFLWENHCYELFLAFDNQPNSPYLEINFAPTGEFNLYHFDGYRSPTQMPPRRLQATPKERQQLINCYNVRHDWHAVFWQDSLPHQQAMRGIVENHHPLDENTHRLVMLIDVKLLAKLLGVKITDKIWVNPCAVFKGEKETFYFAHQHASPPDFHDKKNWIELAI